MLPMEFDHKKLRSLPFPSDRNTRRVFEILNDLLDRKVVPYFRNMKGTDAIRLAQVRKSLSIARMEDDAGQIRLVSLVIRTEKGWSIGIHEHVLDYMAYVMPLTPEGTLKQRADEERGLLAFAEFMLRHDFEHLIYPEKKEQEVVRSDVEFAIGRRDEDPTYYRMLRGALSDEMNGLHGERYLELLDLSEEGRECECTISRMVHAYGAALGDLPDPLLDAIFPDLEARVMIKILGDCYRKTRKSSYSLTQRAAQFQKLLHLFALLAREKEQEATEAFQAFQSRWGISDLFRELGIPDVATDGKGMEELFETFREALEEFDDEMEGETAQLQAGPYRSEAFLQPPSPSAAPQPRTLEERIEEARDNPDFPPQAMEIIDKNKKSASGQSGTKYIELIETLLSIPWSKVQRITVTTKEFEEALHGSHYGLRKQKEIICDFFANLIWRYQQFKGDPKSWHHTGSALLFVGPPGVGKTSLAISVAKSLRIPYHKISLAGMRDEADIRGHGFTYEGSKPGPIVQGLIKMGVMNGMFIMDEVDKTEKIAIGTLLEILDPEQNHLFHDKYVQTSVDIDVSNCHFILTANTMDTVPAPVANRCEIIVLDGYSVEEKVAIARKHLVKRIREKYMIPEDEIYIEGKEEADILREMITEYTAEPGLRDFERILRTLFLRIHRKEILGKGKKQVSITRDLLKKHLGKPRIVQNIDPADKAKSILRSVS